MSAPASKRRLLLVGWDSADWKVIRPLVDKGQMPMVSKLLAEGAHGDLATLEPSLSPMLWTTIGTGRHPADHGVLGFTEAREGRVLPVSASTRRCRALWNILSEHGLRTNLISWFASHGERDPNVRLVSNLYPGAPKGEPGKPETWKPTPPGTYWPESIRETLDRRRVSPDDIDRGLMKMFIPKLDEIDLEKDQRPLRLADKLAETFSVQAAATWAMQQDDWDLTAVYFRAVDEISHHFMPYHPPRLEGLPEKDFELYQDVVNSTYRLHDLMLTRLVDLAGPDAAVVLISDHGFHSDHLRPRFVPKIPAGIIAWHRSHGIFLAAGAGVRRGAVVEGARLPDITPTILGWFGLPRAADMEGRILEDALTRENFPDEVPTWERGALLAEAPTSLPLDESESRKMLEHFVALGYIEEMPEEGAEAAKRTTAQNQMQLAAVLLHSGRYEEALPLLEDAHELEPARPDITQQLAHCQARLGLLDEADATLRPLIASYKNAQPLRILKANLAFQKEDYAGALGELSEADPGMQVHELRARSLLRLRQWVAAENAAREILKLDAGKALGWTIVAKSQQARGDAVAAAVSARRSIALEFNSHESHLVLAQALGAAGQWDEAIVAYENVLRLAPRFFPAYRLLSLALRWRNRHEEADAVRARGQALRAEHLANRETRQNQLKSEVSRRAAERDAVRPPPPPPIEPGEFVIVTGLPRSGTSLMMQMLAAGGLEPMTDGKRAANEDNPRGFLEWEDVKKLPKNPALLSQAKGKAIKIVTPLLSALPVVHRYKLVFMQRPVSEVVRSQVAMIERSGQKQKIDTAELTKRLQAHVDGMLAALGKAKQVQLLVVDYPSLVADPAAQVPRIAEFLGKDILPRPEAMAAAVDGSLRRQKG